MKQFSYLLASLGLFLSFHVLAAPQARTDTPDTVELSILTASEAGTYYAVAEDLEKLVAQSGMDLDVIPTAGAFRNIEELYAHPTIQMALSQLDILALMNTMANGDREIRQQFESLRLVLPLYKEEIHLLVSDKINSISELNGKKVAIGASGSGTSITSIMMLQNAKVAPGELVELEPLRAIDALRKGEIDALFYVVGIPDQALTEEIAAKDGLKLLPLEIEPLPNDRFFPQFYSATTIPANTYSWQPEPVETVAVQSAILTLESADCQQIGQFAKLIYDNLDWLKENGHPKWQTVEFDPRTLRANRRLSPCVAEQLK